MRQLDRIASRACLASELPFVDRLAELYKQLLPRVEVDLLVYTPEELEAMRETSPLVRCALAEGREIP